MSTETLIALSEKIRQLRENAFNAELAAEESDEIITDLRTQLARVTAQRDGLASVLRLIVDQCSDIPDALFNEAHELLRK